MNFVYSFFLAAGVAGFAYSKLGRRVGYGNSQNVWTIVGVVFVIAWLVSYSLMAWVLHLH